MPNDLTHVINGWFYKVDKGLVFFYKSGKWVESTLCPQEIKGFEYEY